MQQNVLELLNIIEQQEEITQRDIAQQTGMSLGMVNILIKKCVKKGLLKIERLNSRSLKYILTAKGISEKSHRTLSYIKRSYRSILKISSYIRSITEEQLNKGYSISILGAQDEIFQLITSTLNEMNVDYQVIHSLDRPESIAGNTAIYFWEPGSIAGFENENYHLVNIMDYHLNI